MNDGDVGPEKPYRNLKLVHLDAMEPPVEKARVIFLDV
jgi:hypothetical protein